jgi:hypothetical protein
MKSLAVRRRAVGMSGPALLAAAIFLSNPTPVAMQDISGLLTGADTRARAAGTPS